jgi:hypothetical protein
MQLRQDGLPIITTTQDQQAANRFVDRVVDVVYNWLPRVVRLFLSKEQLASKLRSAIVQLAGEL